MLLCQLRVYVLLRAEFLIHVYVPLLLNRYLADLVLLFFSSLLLLSLFFQLHLLLRLQPQQLRFSPPGLFYPSSDVVNRRFMLR